METQNAKRLQYPVHSNMDQAENRSIQNFRAVEKYYDAGKHTGINIAFKGSSGAILATMLYDLIKNNPLLKDVEVTLVQIRAPKNGTGHHEGCNFDNTAAYPSCYDVVRRNGDCSNWMDSLNVVVDDFVATGKTLNDIFKHVPMQYTHLVLSSSACWFVKEHGPEFERILFTYLNND